MLLWIANGITLGWLIDDENETISVYRQNGDIHTITGFENRISGEDALRGIALDLSQLEM